MSDLQLLIKKRGALKSRLTRIEKAVYNAKQEKTTTGQVEAATGRMLELRMKENKELYKNFQDLQEQIEILEEQSDEEMEDFEERYYSLIIDVEDILAQTAPSLHQQNSNFSNDATHGQVDQVQNSTINTTIVPSVQLPKITLPTFKGDIIKWAEFHDIFKSIIHDNESLAAIQKFQYLKGALQGEAAHVIYSIPLSDVNYACAWEQLCNRYDNKRIIVNNHVKAIFNLPHLLKENAVQLRELSDGLMLNLRALSALNLTSEQLYDALIVHIVTNKFDTWTARDWEKYLKEDEIPALNNLKTFLNERCKMLENLESLKIKSKQHDIRVPRKERTQQQCLINNQTENRCIICNASHSIHNCLEFNALDTEEKFMKIKQLKRCINCLRSGHLANRCKASGCRKCHARHHTLLHFEKQHEKVNPIVNNTNAEPQTTRVTPVTTTACSIQQSGQCVLLTTAMVEMTATDGCKVPCRALLDSGSQINLITTSLVEKLGLSKYRSCTALSGVGSARQDLQWMANVKVQSTRTAFQMTLSCAVINNICEPQPHFLLPNEKFTLPINVPLADPTFHIPAQIDMLLGAQCFWQLLCVGQIHLNDCGLVLQKTKLGWVLGGQFEIPSSNKRSCNLITDNNLHEQMQKFWEIESFDTPKFPEEKNPCELHFEQTTYRDDSGRFVVSLPLSTPVTVLGDSRMQAYRRFISLERRLQREPELKSQYISFMREYLALGHMSQVESRSESSQFYIPHHGVVNQNSTTTKLRVVFDGSATTSTGFSLNDLMMVGPTVQQDIFSILVRFRCNKIAVCADVEKMYRQVLVRPEDRSLQRILWRECPDDHLKTYELNTVTYGTASAPYLATRCLVEVANIYRLTEPEAARVIAEDYYVDDLCSGASSEEKAAILFSTISRILSRAGFNLRKWASNSEYVLKQLGACEPGNKCYELSSQDTSKPLGIRWLWQSDYLVYDVNQVWMPKTLTKRTILSSITKIFDPLGLLSPITIQTKVLMQRLWLDKLGWDESLSFELYTVWETFYSQLADISEIKIPRLIVCDDYESTQLHGFADASERAYGACIYIRTKKCDSVHVHLICAKTKVAPLKPLTIPRLELCAALLLAKLVIKIVKIIPFTINDIWYWTDSTIVLSWLHTLPSTLTTFVQNRVGAIIDLTQNGKWRHVSSKSNPADCMTRQTKIDTLTQPTSIWWSGPQWLTTPMDNWPAQCRSLLTFNELPETKNNATVFLQHVLTSPIIFNRFSKFCRLKRAFTYVLRFINNTRNRGQPRLSGPLTADELSKAQTKLIQIVQWEMFPHEIMKLRATEQLSAKSHILCLHPFIDEFNVLRVGGRLRQSYYGYDKKHPVLLTKNHIFTKLLAREFHLRHQHAGPTLLLSILREEFWIIGGRSLIRETCRKCVACFKTNPVIERQLMGDLPSVRIEPALPFSKVGIDYCGPLLIRNKPGRGSRLMKAYICVFVCLCTRAVHLELITTLTTADFMGILARFTSRRGKPSIIFSDHGSTFIGAKNALVELGEFLRTEKETIQTSTENNGISWKFIPPRSPHFGGIWEAAVKVAKVHLKRILCNAHLTYEEMYTVLTKIEATMNSRPLSPLSNDPSDYNPLTPAHFLVGRSLAALPSSNSTDMPLSRFARFQLIQQLTETFWKRWKKEYIGELQTRMKWKTTARNTQMGDLVLIKEDNMPPLHWALGRVVDLYPGQDGNIRVIRLKTKSGFITRPIVRVCRLPSND